MLQKHASYIRSTVVLPDTFYLHLDPHGKASSMKVYRLRKKYIKVS
jgi:hypothetical protein